MLSQFRLNPILSLLFSKKFVLSGLITTNQYWILLVGKYRISRRGQKISPAPKRRALTKWNWTAILEEQTKGAARTVSPLKVLWSDRRTCQGAGGHFFLYTWMNRPQIPTMRIQNWNKSEYVTIGQPPFRKIRGQEAAPCPRANRLPFYWQRLSLS